MFSARELNKQIELQRNERVQDPETGYMTDAWVTFATVFAKVEPLVGREYFAAAAVQSENTVKFTIRHNAEVQPADRLVYLGKAYNIKSVINPKARNRETLIMALTIE